MSMRVPSLHFAALAADLEDVKAGAIGEVQSIRDEYGQTAQQRTQVRHSMNRLRANETASNCGQPQPREHFG
jgi:hypothetical protein